MIMFHNRSWYCNSFSAGKCCRFGP